MIGKARTTIPHNAPSGESPQARDSSINLRRSIPDFARASAKTARRWLVYDCSCSCPQPTVARFHQSTHNVLKVKFKVVMKRWSSPQAGVRSVFNDALATRDLHYVYSSTSRIMLALPFPRGCNKGSSLGRWSFTQ